MDAQEIFDTVFTNLYKQGKLSVSLDDHTICLYRGPNGAKCAAGWLIPDELYRPEMENILIGGYVSTGNTSFCKHFGLPKYIEENISLIQSMQDIHDGYSANMELTFRGYIADQFRVIAQEYDLNTAVIDRLPI